MERTNNEINLGELCADAGGGCDQEVDALSVREARDDYDRD